jgi:hypothetical protein
MGLHHHASRSNRFCRSQSIAAASALSTVVKEGMHS